MGHSHIMSLMAAAQSRIKPKSDKPTGLHIYFFDIWKQKTGYAFFEELNGQLAVPADLKSKITSISSEYKSTYLVTLFGGNVYNVIGMMQHSVPFDCILPDFSSPVIKDAQILSIPLIEDIMSALLDLHQMELAVVAEAFSFPTYHMESPPVISDEEFCLRTLEPFFQDNFPNMKISPALLRSKLRTIQSNVYKKTCNKVNAAFVPAPSEAIGPDGYLKREYYGRDGTHANEHYGDLLLKQIESIVGLKLSWWGRFA